MATNGSDIELIFGLAGGGAIGGKTGQHITEQLTELVGHLNSKKQIDSRKLQFSMDLNGTKKNFTDTLKHITSGLSGQKQFKIELKEIDASSAISKLQSDIQAMLSTLSIKNGMTVSIDTATGKITGDATGSKNLEEAAERAKEYREQLSTLMQMLNTLQNSQKTVVKGTLGIDAAKVADLSIRLQALISQIEEFRQAKNQPNQEFVNNIVAATAAINGEIESLRKASTAHTEHGTSMKRSQQELISLQNLLKQVRHARESWTKAENDPKTREQYRALKDLIEDIVNAISGLGDGSLDEFKSRFKDIEASITGAGNATRSFTDRLGSLAQKFSTWFSLTRVIMAAYRAIKQMVNNVVELDSAMTQLQIVTGASDAKMRVFLKNATGLAKELGQSITDILKSIETFSRLGYNLEDSSTLAKFTAVMANVAAVSTEDATTGITSIIKGFNMDVSNTEHVVDVLIEVGQKYAVSASELMEAFQRSGAALNATNTSFEKSAGLIAAANASVQNANTVGTALKTISARIRGSKSELTELGEDTEELADGFSKYAKELKAITGFDIMVDGTTNQFKDIYDILGGIAGVWEHLSDTQQARVSEILGGTRQLQVISSILTNWKDAAGAYQSAMESAGTATEANLRYMESIEGKIGVFKATLQELSEALIGSDFVGQFVELGTVLLNVLGLVAKLIDSLGGLNAVLGFFGGLGIAANANAIIELVKKPFVTLKGVISAVIGGFKTATTSAQIFQSTLGVIGLSIAALTVIFTVFKKLHKSTEDLRAEYEDLAEEIGGLEQELDATKTRIRELQKLSDDGAITLVEQEELDRLNRTNKELETELSLRRAIAAEKAEATNKSVRNDYARSGYWSIAVNSASADAQAFYEQNAGIIDLYDNAIIGMKGAREEFESLSADEQGRIIAVYNQYKELQRSAEYTPTEYLSAPKYANELIARYNELSALGSDVTIEQIHQMDSIRSSLLSLSNDLLGYLDIYVGEDEYTAMWRATLDAIDACINRAEHFTELLDKLPGDVKEALSAKSTSGDLTAGDVGELANKFPELSAWMSDSGYTAEEVAMHYNALSRSIKEIGEALEPITEKTVSDVVETIAKVEGEINKVSQVLGEFSENGAVGAATLDTLRETFGECETFQAFVDVMSDASSTMEDAKKASNALATEWINKLDLLSLVNEDTAGAVEALLELTGVTNAHEVVEAKLTAVMAARKAADYDAMMQAEASSDAVWDNYKAIMNDVGATEAEIAALKRYKQEQYNARLATIDLTTASQGQTKALLQQAKAAGLSMEKQMALQQIQSLQEKKANGYQKTITLANGQEITISKDLSGAIDRQIEYWVEKARVTAEELDEILNVEIPPIEIGDISIGGSGGTPSAKKEVEAYLADIDRLYKKREALARQELANSRLSDRISNTDDLREKIKLQTQYVQGLKNEQARLHDIAGDRNADGTYNYATARAEILENLETLERVYGVTAKYNPETNELLFDDLNQINNQVVEIKKGMTSSDIQEAINDKIKAAEDLVDTVLDQVDATKDWSAAWIDAQYAIRETNLGIIEDLKAIVEETSSAVDEIQNVYDTLQKAADEFEQSDGYISVDTFQDIMNFGPEYLRYLTDENGLLVINREAINGVIKARTEQLAIENAMSYVERIRMALQKGAVESLDQLIGAQSKYNGTLWDTVYANLELAKAEGLTDEQYVAAKHNVDAIFSLLAGVNEQFDEYIDGLEEAKDITDKILKWTMDMLKKRVQDEIDDLEDLKDKYGELIQARKNALDMAKDEDDYQDIVLEKTKRLAELQGKIDLLALDDSRDAQAKRKALMEEMADVQKELDELQRDHSIEQQKASLDQMQEDYEKEKDEEIKILEDSISSYQKIYDKAIDYINRHWDTLKDELIQWNYEVGDTIEDEITGNWEKAIAAMKRYGLEYADLVRKRNEDKFGFSGWGSGSSSGSGASWMVGSSSTVASSSSGSTTANEVNARKAAEVSKRVAEMKELAARWHQISDPDTRASLHAQAAGLAAEIKEYGVEAKYDPNSGAWIIKRDDLNSGNINKDLYSVYHTGGIVGGGTVRENEQLALLQKGEPVISNSQKQTLFDLIDFMGMMRTKLENANFTSIDLVSSSRSKQMAELMAKAPVGNTPSIRFGDVYIYGGDAETVRKHQEINRAQANEVLKYLKIRT